jgi:hypothetical protein
VDARIKKFIDEEVSIGEYVLTGGELPAMVMIDSITRLLPGVLGNKASVIEESHSEEGLAESPQYTRPEIFIANKKKYPVPKILLSGDHKKIEEVSQTMMAQVIEEVVFLTEVEAPLIEEEVSQIEEEAPLIEVEVFLIEEEAPLIEEEALLIEEEVSLVEEVHPTEGEVSQTEGEELSIEEGISQMQEEIIIHREASIIVIEEKVFPIEEVLGINKEIFQDQKVIIKKTFQEERKVVVRTLEESQEIQISRVEEKNDLYKYLSLYLLIRTQTFISTYILIF